MTSKNRTASKHSLCTVTFSLCSGVIVFIVITALVLSRPLGANAAESVQVVLSKSRQTLRLIQTVEFVQTFNVLDKTQRHRFVAKGNYCLSEQTIDIARGSNSPDVITAFDGRRHQELIVAASHLAHSQSAWDAWPVGTENALMTPFYWVRDLEKPFTYSQVRDTANWERIAKQARLVGEKEENGVRLIEVELTFPKTKAYVDFSPAHGYFPLRWRAGESGVQVKAWETFEVDGAPGIVPLEIERVGIKGLNHEPHTTHILVDRKTLKINQPIDDDVFTISPTRADEIVDRDAPAELPAPAHRTDTVGSPVVFYVSLGLAGFAVISIGLAWYLRRS